ncbi:MAG TPA: right-handed parallel beta-helix repeat-containing protein, partial [Roseiflexaceae bacterium]|nr:right-handed parallel beta-helix repeat-containing protein [Roseiflexaceae bacterium]
TGPKIELNGELRQGDTNGFTIQSTGNVIDGFVINGFLRGSSINRGIGIFINDDAADNNIIRNNWIGLAIGGVNANGNDYAGIYIRGGDGNQILSNVISGNGSATTGVTSNIIIGVAVDSDLYVTDNTTVAGNLIGTNPSGTAAIGGGNPQSGVRVAFRANNTLIGGSNVAARNIISGNNNANVIPNRSGVYVDSTNQSGTVIRGNYIGTNAAGSAAIPNYYGVSIVDGANNVVVDGNLISGNSDNGVNAAQELRSTSGLAIQNNIIGLSVGGAALGNGGEGIALIRRQDKFGTVGVTGSTVQGNTISANGRNGILVGNDDLAGSLFANNVITGNAIGTRLDKTGTDSTLVNGRYAIEVASGTGIRIGGATAPERNVIAARTNFAGLHLTGANVSAAQVLGNSIGLNANGSSALTAEATARATYGVLIDLGSNGNTVGGGNLIGANRYGIHVKDSSNTTIAANSLGVAGAGNEQFGVWLLNAANTTIGGGSAAQGNTLASNGRNGIFAEGSSSGLTIGFNTVSSSVQEGIVLLGAGVSGAVLNSNNVSGNQSDGVLVDAATGVRITRTTTNNNTGDGIRLANGGNANRAAPTLSATLVSGPNGQPAVTGTASGCASPGCVVEIFSSATRADGEGPRFLASATADPASGAFTIEIPGCDRFLTATARDPQNNTSPFSTPMVDTVTGCTAAKPTLSAGT